MCMAFIKTVFLRRKVKKKLSEKENIQQWKLNCITSFLDNAKTCCVTSHSLREKAQRKQWLGK